MPLPHCPGAKINHTIEYIYLAEDRNAKQYVWSSGLVSLTLFNNKTYKIGFSEHNYEPIPLYYRCEYIEIEGINYAIRDRKFEKLLDTELIPLSVYRENRINDILDD